MTLSDQQWEFARHISMLIIFAEMQGFKLTFAEAYRTKEQQAAHVAAGRSQTMNSDHLKRLAVDFNIFRGGKWIGGLPAREAKEIAQVLGDFWETLHPMNYWGGNWTSFVDVPHFGRKES